MSSIRMIPVLACLGIVVIVTAVVLLLHGGRGEQPEPPGAPSEPSCTGGIFKPQNNLKWDKCDERFDGWLTVPLDPRNDSSGPQLKLRLRMRPAPEQPAPLGTMIVHCGGPGSDRFCVDGLLGPAGAPGLVKEIADKYNIVAIDQRGIGESEPVLHCGQTEAALPPVGAKPKLTDFFPQCECDGLPSFSVRFEADEWEASHNYFSRLSNVSQECYKRNALKRGKYNVMDYMGTAYLAHDLDRFRAAIGAEKLSLHGISYGTWVGSVYASLYPERTDKLILDGNLPPAPTVPDFARDYAINQQGVRAEFVARCRLLTNCSRRDPEVAFREATEKLDNGEYSAESDFGTVYITQFLITGMTHNLLRDYTNRRPDPDLLIYTQFADLLNDILDVYDNVSARSQFVENLLNSVCSLTLPESKLGECVDKHNKSLAGPVVKGFFQCPTWKQYGMCASGPRSNRGMQAGLLYTAVMSGDIPSHLLPSQMVDLERRLKHDFGVIGARAAYILDSVAVWPSKSSYPAIGTLEVSPLIMSQLDDSATGFKWTQEMKLAFPGSSLMTFQGFFHGFVSPYIQRDPGTHGLYGCYKLVQKYILEGALPRNGHVCHVNRFGIDDPPVLSAKVWDFLPASPEHDILRSFHFSK